MVGGSAAEVFSGTAVAGLKAHYLRLSATPRHIDAWHISTLNDCVPGHPVRPALRSLADYVKIVSVELPRSLTGQAYC
ncbi:hypothetical protein B2J88_22945 [Rhodococcus sp. SRB_17]|nr:hypothetical protein [Rhodococcus sp. SRB_17]OYD70058.1 hypothetical protein BDB13_3648 [Rhodococcus sp. OK302]